jgi:hypothetical protein
LIETFNFIETFTISNIGVPAPRTEPGSICFY